MRKFMLAAAALSLWSVPAQAQCTPEGNARFAATQARLNAAAARIRAGDCSAVADWRRALAAQHAILRRSQQQTYPYTCTVTIKYPSPPPCGGTKSAKAAADKKKQAAAKKEASSPSAVKRGEAPSSATPKSASCSDITGTGSTAPAATHCKDADRALYAARQIRQNNPQVADAEYKKAAAAARRAGDTTLELNILREAVEIAASATAAAVAPSAPVAPAGPVAAAASASAAPAAADAVRRMWDGTREKCDTANQLERATAGWYVMCVQPVLPKRQETGYRPNPDPLELQKQARQACGSYSRDTQRCFSEFKLKVILEQNPGMRAACEKSVGQRGRLRQQLRDRLGMGAADNHQAILECVDNAYLYGDLDASAKTPRNSLREELRNRLYGSPDDTKGADGAGPKSIVCSDTERCCKAGFGMKPTPGAFGAWSCQPLGLLALNATQRRLDGKGEAEYIDDVEERVGDIVTNAVAAAVDAFGAAMSQSDRDACAAASLAATRSVLKGGAPRMSEQCRAMAEAARSFLALYANVHLDHSSDAMEELLAGFRVELGRPLPGMTGLLPDERLQRVGECLRQGGSAENCN